MNVRFRAKSGRFSKYSSRKVLQWESFGTDFKTIEKSGAYEKISKIDLQLLEAKTFEDICDKIFTCEPEPNETIRQALVRIRATNRLKGFRRVDIQIEGYVREEIERKRRIKPIRLSQISLVYDLPKRQRFITKGKREGEHSTPVDNISYAIRDFLRNIGYAISPRTQRKHEAKKYKRMRQVVIRICAFK